MKVVLLKGINVGGHRTFRPSVLAKKLKRLDVVNIGAAGTFVIRKPVGRVELRAELLRLLPFEAEVMICDARDILRLVSSDPFAGQPVAPDIIRFVSILAKRRKALPSVPLDLPAERRWCMRILGQQDRFVLGLYRREMQAIGYLGQLEKIFGVPVATRNWNTILSIAGVLTNGPHLRARRDP